MAKEKITTPSKADLELRDLIQHNRLSLAKLTNLIEQGADINAVFDGNTPLTLACMVCRDEEIVKMLLEHGAQVNIAATDGETPLIWACRLDRLGIVRMLLENGAQVNVADKYGETPLIWACRLDHLGIVKMLLEKGAQVNVADEDGETPLIWACKLNRLGIFKMFLEKGAQVNMGDKDGSTPLIWACRLDRLEIVKMLLEKGAQVNVANTNGETPLIWACMECRDEIVKLLLEHGAQVNVADKYGKTPLIWACDNWSYNTVAKMATTKLLLERGADVNLMKSDLLATIKTKMPLVTLGHSLVNPHEPLEARETFKNDIEQYCLSGGKEPAAKLQELLQVASKNIYYGKSSKIAPALENLHSNSAILRDLFQGNNECLKVIDKALLLKEVFYNSAPVPSLIVLTLELIKSKGEIPEKDKKMIIELIHKQKCWIVEEIVQGIETYPDRGDEPEHPSVMGQLNSDIEAID